MVMSSTWSDLRSSTKERPARGARAAPTKQFSRLVAARLEPRSPVEPTSPEPRLFAVAALVALPIFLLLPLSLLLLSMLPEPLRPDDEP